MRKKRATALQPVQENWPRILRDKEAFWHCHLHLQKHLAKHMADSQTATAAPKTSRGAVNIALEFEAHPCSYSHNTQQAPYASPVDYKPDSIPTGSCPVSCSSPHLPNLKGLGSPNLLCLLNTILTLELNRQHLKRAA